MPFKRVKGHIALFLILLLMLAGFAGCSSARNTFSSEMATELGMLPDTRAVYVLEYGATILFETDQAGIFLRAKGLDEEGSQALRNMGMLGRTAENALELLLKGIMDRGYKALDQTVRVVVIPLSPDAKTVTTDRIELVLNQMLQQQSTGSNVNIMTSAKPVKEQKVMVQSASLDDYKKAIQMGIPLTRMIWPVEQRPTPEPTLEENKPIEASPTTTPTLNPDAPILPNNAVLTTQLQPDHTVLVSWQLSTSLNGDSKKLQYLLYYAENLPMGNVTEIQHNGTPVGDWAENIKNASITGLKDYATYIICVLVRDAVGNMVSYPAVYLMTGDTAAPLPGEEGSLSVINITTFSASVKWKAAMDDGTVPSKLQYTLYYSTVPLDSVEAIQKDGIVAGRYKGTLQGQATHLDSGKTYYVNVLVTDLTGNTSIYKQQSFTTLTHVVPTTEPPATVTPTPLPTIT